VSGQGETPFCCVFLAPAWGYLPFLFGTKSIWLGGTSIPRSWLYNFFQKISIYMFYELIYEFNHYPFYLVNGNDLYVVVDEFIFCIHVVSIFCRCI